MNEVVNHEIQSIEKSLGDVVTRLNKLASDPTNSEYRQVALLVAQAIDRHQEIQEGWNV
jgi:preprotein translocase subunit Sss1